MINKTFESVAAALDGIADGSVIMVGGFGTAGMPSELVDGVIASGARELTIISNNAGNGEIGLAALLKAGRVAKVICSFPRQSDSYVFDELYLAGRSSLKSCHKAIWPNVSARQALESVRFIRPPGMARCWPKARKPE